MLTLVALFLFPYLIWTAGKNIRLARESTGWPTTPGTITSSKQGKVMWRAVPRVTYSYQVDGKDYSGSNITIGGAPSGKETEPTLSRYPEGSAVMVHYLPKQPAVAALEPGPNRYASAVLRTYIAWLVIIVGGQAARVAVDRWSATHQEADAPVRTYGDGTPGDGETGDQLIRDGADNGDAKDEGYVGTWYLGGLEGYQKDPAEAAKWFRKSAEQGDAGSQNLLGQLYVQGQGVPRDYPTALQWFLKAADQGEPHSCVWVGVACEQGIAGMPKDKNKAIEWYKKAGNEPKAKEMLARLGVK